MKNIIFLCLSCISFVVCGQQKCNCDITVYGDVHQVSKSFKTDSIILKKIIFTQKWLHKRVNETIVVVEGIPASGKQLTKDVYIDQFLLEIKKRSGIILDRNIGYKMLTESSKSGFDVKSIFILEGKKKVFGGEDDSLFRIFISNPYAVIDTHSLNLRSAAILKNTIDVCHKNPGSHIAIVIGRRHLDWFRKMGYKVYDVPF